MNSIKCSAGVLLAAGLFVTCAMAAEPTVTNVAPAKAGTDLFDAVIAKGKGLEIKRSRLDEEMVSLKAAAAARGQTIPPEQMGQLERQILDRLVNIQLLVNKATEAEKVQGKENTAKRIEEIRTRAGSEENLTRQLKVVGTSLAELEKKMGQELTAEGVLERELKINVTDADVKKFYEENPAKFEQPEMVRASHILLSTRNMESGEELSAEKKAEKKKLAEDLLKRARAGEDFAKLAKEYSEDPGSKDNGGEYTFPKGKMVPEFEAAAFGLKTNEVSDIVTTQFGFHIIKLAEKMTAQKVELAKVSPDIKNFLKSQAVQKELPAFSEKLKKDAEVQIMDPKLKLEPQGPEANVSAPTPADKPAGK